MRTRCVCFALVIIVICPPASAQWVQTNGPNGVDIRCIATSGPNLFVGTYGSGVYLSTNKGASWTAVNTGLPQYKYINTLAVDGAHLYAGTAGGVFVSTNNGTSWYSASGMTGRDVHSFAASGANLFAGTWDSGVFVSTNNGTTWTAVNIGSPMLIVLSLVASGTNIFVGLDEGAGVFRSTDNGTSWAAARAGLTNGTVNTLAISGTNLFAGTNEGVFRSTDNGADWTAVNSGVPVDTHGFYPFIPVLAVAGASVFAGTIGYGVLLSTNDGLGWTPVNDGLPFTYINTLAVDGANLYAGSNAIGVWLRPLSQMITTSVSEPSCDLPTTFGLDQNYPNPFNPSAIIKYELPRSAMVRLSVFDMLGREVSVLVNERRDAGVHQVTFDARNLASGVYFYRLQAGSFAYTEKMLVVR